MDGILNFNLLRHPANWLIIFVIGLGWIYAFDLIQAYISGRHPADTMPPSALGSR